MDLQSLTTSLVMQRDLNDPFDGMYLEDLVYWLSTMLLTAELVLTSLYDLAVDEVFTGGLIYSGVTLPVLGYSLLELYVPYQSRQAYMMLLVNDYLKIYFLFITYIALYYYGTLNCNTFQTGVSQWEWVNQMRQYFC